MSKLLTYCPECSHPLNNNEGKLGKCQNCQASWDPDDIDEDLDIEDLELDDDNDF